MKKRFDDDVLSAVVMQFVVEILFRSSKGGVQIRLMQSKQCMWSGLRRGTALSAGCGAGAWPTLDNHVDLLVEVINCMLVPCVTLFPCQYACLACFGSEKITYAELMLFALPS